MRRSQTITLQIERSVEDVYDFLADPYNHCQWSVSLPGTMRHVAGNEWQADTQIGPRRFQFCARNGFGVLDHAVYREGETPMFTPFRVADNDGGTEVIYTFYQRDTMSEAQFVSTMEWITGDLWALKSILEA